MDDMDHMNYIDAMDDMGYIDDMYGIDDMDVAGLPFACSRSR